MENLKGLILFGKESGFEVVIGFSEYLNHYQITIKETYGTQGCFSIRDGGTLGSLYGSDVTVEGAARDFLQKASGKRITLSKNQKTGEIKELPKFFILR